MFVFCLVLINNIKTFFSLGSYSFPVMFFFMYQLNLNTVCQNIFNNLEPNFYLNQNMFHEFLSIIRVSWSWRTTKTLVFRICFANSISLEIVQCQYLFILHAYWFRPTKNIFQTKKHTLKKQTYLIICITRNILAIWRIKTTFSKNQDCPVILLKNGQNCATILALLDNHNHLVGQLEQPPV